MILYHGSNVEIFQPDLSKSKPYKDFGKGFYLSANKKQAIRMAEQKASLLQNGAPIVTEFDFDENFEELVQELKYAQGITFQYYFGTELALSKLIKR